MTDINAYTRRRFLHDGLCLISATATIPTFLQSSAFAMFNPAAQVKSQPGVPDDHILVVIQLGGGNDGLNTVVPYGWDEYYRARPSLAVPRKEVLTLGSKGAADGLGLHPSLTGFRELYDDGKLGVILGVGYPNPNRSHFKSMDIWQTADRSGKGLGWLGRYFDNTCNGSPVADAAIAIGQTAPLALHGSLTSAVTFEDAGSFRWQGRDLHEALAEPYDRFNRSGVRDGADPDSNLGFLMRTSLDAQVVSDRVIEAVETEDKAQYPQSRLASDLKMVARMIAGGLGTKVYYVNHGSFDTHAGQAGRHARLLSQLGDAVNAFYRDLADKGESGRVLIMTFSEFGRRVGQNGSGGTDHGTAAPMFIIGDPIRPGVLGAQPSLTDLDAGDLKYNLDFRSVYAGVLEDWFKVKSGPILKGTFRKAKIIS